METVSAAFAAAVQGRFDDLGELLAPEIDWLGVPEADGERPHCHGRDAALQWMRVGLVANDRVAVGAFEQSGDRVMAQVRRNDDDDERPPEWFVVAEVQDGQITRLCGYRSESDARADLHAG